MTQIKEIKFTNNQSAHISYSSKNRLIKKITIHLNDGEQFCLNAEDIPAEIRFNTNTLRLLPVELQEMLFQRQLAIVNQFIISQKFNLEDLITFAKSPEWREGVTKSLQITEPPELDILNEPMISLTWYSGGLRQCLNGPALMQYSIGGDLQHEAWYYQSKLHRFDGPASIAYLPQKKLREWHIYGKRITVDELRSHIKIKGKVPDQFDVGDAAALKLIYR